MFNLVMMTMIFNKKNEKEFINLLNKYKVKFKAITFGKGTASSSVLEYFGLNELDKVLLLSIMPYNMSKHILKDLNNKFLIEEPGNGIAFTIPISSSTQYIKDKYTKDMEDIEMEDANKHLILTIVNDGYAESVMNSAKKAGATGGTSLNGRGLETEKIIKFLGISIEPEKNIVMILADEDKKNAIMNSIVEECGLKTPGAGICFSLPVSNVVGLKNHE